MSFLKNVQVVASFWVVSSTAFAEETRFTLEEFASGYLILNDQSDIVSTCNKTDNGFSCQFQKDSRVFLKNRVQELEEKVETLEARLNEKNKDAELLVETTVLEEQPPIVETPSKAAELAENSKSVDDNVLGDLPGADHVVEEDDNKGRLISAEMRKEATAFLSNLMNRLFDFVDSVKKQTIS